MPTGKVKWYDPDKGFGFLSQEGGEDVYVRSSALPTGVEALKAGQRVEFGIASGRRGPQALSLRLIEPPPSLSRPRREPAAEHKHSPDELHGMVEDMITLLESTVQPELRKGALPGSQDCSPGRRGCPGGGAGVRVLTGSGGALAQLRRAGNAAPFQGHGRIDSAALGLTRRRPASS